MKPLMETAHWWLTRWRQRPSAERWRLAVGALLILSLSLYLVWQHAAGASPRASLSWSALARQAQALSIARPLEAGQWQQQAAQVQMVLLEARQEPDHWIIKGETTSPQALQQLMDWAARQGWWARQWQLRQSAEGLLFELRVEALQP